VALRDALDALGRGEFVLVFDSEDREGETDLVIASQSVTPSAVKGMRTRAGGLICTTVPPRAANTLGLPFAQELLESAASKYEVLRLLKAHDILYDRRSSFSITINHRDTFTGIPDTDRARTISEFARLVEEAGVMGEWEAKREFGARFRSPGHVPLLIAHERLLEARRGHTELATALVEAAGLGGSATVCEMLSPAGRALRRAEARRFAARHGLEFLEGAEIAAASRPASKPAPLRARA
jgi:3,4-dihydroxy 2-butanone 4-phosphate synthase